MRKILNPYTRFEGYQCFGCSPDNKNGLRMEFAEDGDAVVCEWEPKDFLQGFFNILHGGIQAALMDEIGFWLVQVKVKTAGVTSSMNIRLLRTVPTDKGKIKLVARLKTKRRNLVDVHVELFCPGGELCAEGVITYFTYKPEIAREKLYYPEPDEFFEKDI